MPTIHRVYIPPLKLAHALVILPFTLPTLLLIRFPPAVSLLLHFDLEQRLPLKHTTHFCFVDHFVQPSSVSMCFVLFQCLLPLQPQLSILPLATDSTRRPLAGLRPTLQNTQCWIIGTRLQYTMFHDVTPMLGTSM